MSKVIKNVKKKMEKIEASLNYSAKYKIIMRLVLAECRKRKIKANYNITHAITGIIIKGEV